MRMNKVFLFLFIAATLAVNDSTLESTLQADNFKCSDLEKMFNVKNQLQYWNELKDMDLVQQISDILEVKESLLNYKELIFNKQTVKKQGVKVLLEKIGKTITDIVHDLQGEKELTIEYCDSTIKEINKILQQRDSEKTQLQNVKKETITSKLQTVTQFLDHCNRELKPAHHNQLILQQSVQSNKNTEVGYGYWFRVLTFYPEEYQSDGYFLSRVAENEHFTGDDLGDNKLLALIKKDDLVLSTYDIKSMNQNIEQNIPIEKNKWTYLHFSYCDGQAVAYVFFDKDDISKVEFHVEHFKLSNAIFKFGGKDLNYEGLNGQFAQLTYGLGKQYVIDNPQAFIQEVQQISPMPKFEKLEFELISKTTEYPQEFKKEFNENFIDEFALSAWFKIEYLDAENIEIFRISDQHKYALSLFGGNSLSFGTYSVGQQLRKVELYEQTDDWHFIYMSYSYLKEEFNCFVWINGHIIKLQEHSVKHVPTSQLKLSIEKEFDGEINEMKLYIGEGSHIDDPKQLPNEYQVGLDMVEKSMIRSFEVTHSQNPQTVLAENSNLRKNNHKLVTFEVHK